jgi:hypothetical protein
MPALALIAFGGWVFSPALLQEPYPHTILAAEREDGVFQLIIGAFGANLPKAALRECAVVGAGVGAERRCDGLVPAHEGVILELAHFGQNFGGAVWID